MKMAMTAAEASVEAPKINRKSRCQAIWYTSAQKPEPKTSSEQRQSLRRTRASGKTAVMRRPDQAGVCLGQEPGRFRRQEVAVGDGRGELDGRHRRQEEADCR